jgi:hypothetical protein
MDPETMLDIDLKYLNLPSADKLEEHYTHMFINETGPVAASLIYNRLRNMRTSIWKKIERRDFDDVKPEKKQVHWTDLLRFPMKKNRYEQKKVENLNRIFAHLQAMENAYNALFVREPVLGDLVLSERVGIATVGKVLELGKSGSSLDDQEDFKLDSITVDDCPGRNYWGRRTMKPENILCILEHDLDLVLEEKDPVAVYNGRQLRCAGFAGCFYKGFLVYSSSDLHLSIGNCTEEQLKNEFRAIPLKAKKKDEEEIKKDGPYR